MYPKRLLLLSIGLLSLAGCGGKIFSFSFFKTTCAKPVDFANVVENGRLVVPVGLDGPDTRDALLIPLVGGLEMPRSAEAPCIDSPPKFASPAPKRPQA